MGMIDLTLQIVVMRLAAALIIIGVHGFAVAGFIGLLGDPGPRQDGRLTANPFRHLDVIGGLLLVLFTVGWIRPIAADAARMRGGRIGLAAIVAAGSAATLAVPIALRLIRPMLLNALGDTESAAVFVLIETIGELGLSFTLFNIVPLPPLTGAHGLAAAFPAHLGLIRRAGFAGSVLLAVLVVSGVVGRLMAPIMDAVGP